MDLLLTHVFEENATAKVKSHNYYRRNLNVINSLSCYNTVHLMQNIFLPDELRKCVLVREHKAYTMHKNCYPTSQVIPRRGIIINNYDYYETL